MGSWYRPGTLKKALVAFSAVGITGAVIRYKSHSQAQLLEGLEEHEEQGLAWYLQEALDVTTGSAREAGHTLLAVLHALRHAWDRRLVPAAGQGSGGSSSIEQLSMPVAVAEFLGSMAEEADRSRVGFVLAGYKVLDWLLDTAVAAPASPERAAVQRLLVRMLSDEEASCALLERPGALPKLLRLTAAAPAAGAGACAAAQGQDGTDAAALAALLGGVAAQGGKLPMRAPLEDVGEVLDMACGGAVPPGTQLLALQFLTALAATSLLNCTALAEVGAVGRLADLAAAASSQPDAETLQLELAHLMMNLASHTPDPASLHMSRWLYHLLCFVADATADRNWGLATASLAAFSHCLRAGSKLQERLLNNNALPLLRQLADGKAAARGAAGAVPMRAAIASAVGALAESRGARFPQAERERWSEVLLGWVGEQPVGDGLLAHTELMRALAGALAGLASPPGAEGLHIAHAWLAEILVHLSRQIEAAQARSRSKKGALVVEIASPAGTSSSRAAAGSPGGSSWWKFWASSSASSSSSGGSGGTGAAAAVGPAASEESAAAAEAEAAVEIDAVPPSEAAAAGAEAGSPPDAAAGSSDASSSSSSGGPAAVAASAGEKEGWGSRWWWPWGHSAGDGSGHGAAGAVGGEAGAGSPRDAYSPARPASDSELSEFLKAAPVGPLYARCVAEELLEASGRVGTYQEPPPNLEDLMSPDAIATYAKVAAAIDMEVADKALCQALKVLCALVSGDAERQRWLQAAGVLPLLRRLTISHPRDIPEVTSPDFFEDTLPLCVRRQAARLLAMLSTDPEGARAVRKGGWVPWLQNIAVSKDCKVSSCAARALLHIESAGALHRTGPTARPWQAMRKGLKRWPLLLPEPEQAPEGDVLEQAQQKLQKVRRKIDRQLDVVRPPVSPPERLVMGDGVHLFDPLASHHEVLAREGTGSQSKDAPLVDIVFVHGIRGGAFATWRREGVLERGQARENLERDTCWPGAWLAKEVPEARLLSIEYPAPASGWEGESLPLLHTAARVMEKLVAAGVGQRPVLFVSHSMGGLVVKEMLAMAERGWGGQDERFKKLAASARGAVFYSVPHFGAKLAAYGWQLRYVGGSPAAAVEHLRPGQHLLDTNSAVKAMYKSGRLPVLSFSEGQQTKLGYVKTNIVPHESAFPGYGEFVVLAQHDHINVCKPADQQDPAYARLAAFVRARVAEVRQELAEQAAGSMDHMEPAL